MGNDWQLLYKYKHNLVQKWRVRFLGARFDAAQRALVSHDNCYKICIDSSNQIAVEKI